MYLDVDKTEREKDKMQNFIQVFQKYFGKTRGVRKVKSIRVHCSSLQNASI